MAITDAGKQFESAFSGTDPKKLTFTAPIKAGGLVVLFMGGKRTAANLSVVSVKDTQNNTYKVYQWASTTRFAAIAIARTVQPMGTDDSVTVDFSGGPTYAWVSGHVFEGASDVPIGTVAAQANSSTVGAILPVSGSDWLTLVVATLPYDAGVTITPINSSISQDDNAASGSPPWIECFSRNGTTGTTHTCGGSVPSALQYGAVGVSLPALALPSGTRAAQPVFWF
jgi:hypothetical protein